MSQTGSDRFAFWRSRGVSVRTANVLITLGCQSIEDVWRLDIADQRVGISGIGRITYDELSGLMSGAPPKPLWTPADIPEPVWTPDDIYEAPPVVRPVRTPVAVVVRPPRYADLAVCKTVYADEQQIDFAFVCPPEWRFGKTTVMRTKIERGIISFKPGDQNTGFQKMPIIDYARMKCRTIMRSDRLTGSASRFFINRAFILIKQMGWTEDTSYFVMSPAQRGWYEITKPSAEPSQDQPYVRIEKLSSTGGIDDYSGR